MLLRGHVLLIRSAGYLRSQCRGCSPRIEMLPRGHVPLKYRNTLTFNTLFNRRVPWINTHCTGLHGRGRLDRRRQHGVVSRNDTLPNWRALWKCWTELYIDTLPNWRDPWICAQCARVHGRERLCGKRYQSAQLDIETLPCWRAPWIRAQCARIHGRERLCGRRYRSAPLDIETLPTWHAPWICAQCARVNGRERLCGRHY